MKPLYLLFLLAVFVGNIPFGLWRRRAKEQGNFWEMIVAIHLPVVFIVAARFAFGFAFSFSYIAASVLAFFLGQFVGGKLCDAKRREGA